MKKSFVWISIIGLFCLMSITTSCASDYTIEQVTDNFVDDWRPSLCVDNLGRPHMVWFMYEAPFEIYYAVKESSHWEISKVKTLF